MEAQSTSSSVYAMGALLWWMITTRLASMRSGVILPELDEDKDEYLGEHSDEHKDEHSDEHADEHAEGSGASSLVP